jgi:50S ribosomal protein L16 3-hydroxylase
MLLDNNDTVDLPTFLTEFWQKKPLLLKNALPGFADFLSPEELAGMACEEGVESRIVFNTSGNWDMKNGPFTEREFTFLPEQDWTLLVQSVDHWVPEVKSLLKEVTFIPSWRLDDVMVSYAAQGGGVGPHFDYYDVFLVQGQGSRRWQLGKTCNSKTTLNTASGLKILEDFSPEQTIELSTGDVLYIPAGMSHCGTAVEPGLCYSIGFRAPDVAELLSAYSHLANDTLPGDLRYRDPVVEADARPGDISESTLQQVKVLMQHALDNEELLLQSFGCLMTEPRLPELLEAPETELTPEQLIVQLQKGMQLICNPATRLACHHRSDGLYVFVNGECLVLPADHDKLSALNTELQSAIGRTLNLMPFQRNEACLKLLAWLYNQGYLVENI